MEHINSLTRCGMISNKVMYYNIRDTSKILDVICSLQYKENIDHQS